MSQYIKNESLLCLDCALDLSIRPIARATPASMGTCIWCGNHKVVLPRQDYNPPLEVTDRKEAPDE